MTELKVLSDHEADQHQQDNRPSVYLTTEGRWRYRTSALGSCLRELVACRLGYEPEPFDEDSEIRMGEGRIHEPYILDRIAALYGQQVNMRQVRVTLPCGVVGDYETETSGSMDGAILRVENGKVVVDLVEGKAVSSYGAEKFASEGVWAEPRYVAQVSGYWWAAMFTLAPIEVKRIILAIKNRNTGKVNPIELTKPPQDLLTVQTRVTQAERFAQMSLQLSGGKQLPTCEGFSAFCKYRYLHDITEVAKQVVRKEHLTPLMKEYTDLGKVMTQAKSRRAEILDEIAVEISPEEKTLAGDYKARWIKPEALMLDQAALRNDHPELFRAYQRRPRSPYIKVWGGPKDDENDVEESEDT